ncbi:MAG: TolC family protein [Candidatus Omnitrophica bacterium]|nr:TolC family protein [Candidatus Omnitrophota bacterium]
MLQTDLKKTAVFLIFIGFFVLFFCSFCLAEQPASLKNFNINKTNYGLDLHLEHSRPPVLFTVDETERPYRLIINVIGSRVTFKEYENIPIEIPVNHLGIKKVIVAEKINYNMSPKESVSIVIELDRKFKYDLDAQFNGQYIDLKIWPGSAPAQKENLAIREKEIKPTEQIKIVKASKDFETKKAREKLEKFTQKKRIALIREESEEKLSQVRDKAKERFESGTVMQEVQQKLQSQTDLSTLPSARAQMVEKNIYQDINMPSEIKPMLKRNTGTNVTSYQDCINIAMAAHLPVQIAKEQEKLAQLRVREARRAFYPSFLGEWNESDGNTVTEPYRGRSYGVQAEQQLFTGGKLMATLRKEQLGLTISKGNTDRVKQDLMFEVSKAYYEMVLSKITLDMMLRLKTGTAKILDEVLAEFAIQSATPAELLGAQASFNRVCFQVANAERGMAMAKLALEKEMFTEALNVDELDYHLGRKKINVNLDECRELAFRHRAEIKVMEQTMQAAKYSQDIIKSEELPNVSLVGTYGRSGESFSQRDLNLATEWSLMGKVKWFLGGNTVETFYKKDKVSPFKVTKTDTNVDSQALNAKFSFWDNLAHFSKSKEAQITRKQALKDYEEMKNKIRQETEDSYYSYQKYSVQLSLAINEIGYRRKQLEIAKTRKGMNEASGADIIDAEMQLVEANSNMQQALAGINLSIASLNRAIGVINYFH